MTGRIIHRNEVIVSKSFDDIEKNTRISGTTRLHSDDMLIAGETEQKIKKFKEAIASKWQTKNRSTTWASRSHTSKNRSDST